MLDIIITSKTRIKLLIKFFLVDGNRGYLRGLEKEFDESTNSIRIELNRFVKARLLTWEYKGKKRFYKANPEHPLYNDLKNLVHKSVGIDQIVERVANHVGDLDAVFVTGNFAEGIDSDVIELALVGQNLNKLHIDSLVQKAEKMITRKIMYLTFNPEQMQYFFKDRPSLLIWQK